MRKYWMLLLFVATISIFPLDTNVCVVEYNCHDVVSIQGQHHCESMDSHNPDFLAAPCEMDKSRDLKGNAILENSYCPIPLLPRLTSNATFLWNNLHFPYIQNNQTIPRFFPEETIQFLS